MTNLESVGEVPGNKSSRPEHLEVPIEYILGEQNLLMRLMVPSEIKPYVEESDGEHAGIEDELFLRWNMKYSVLFREFCDGLDPVVDAEIIERLRNGVLKHEDYARIQNYLEDEIHVNSEEGIGGHFFENSEEIQAFLKQYVH
jgi:hypothetical protein